jgi:hypothetical protein
MHGPKRYGSSLELLTFVVLNEEEGHLWRANLPTFLDLDRDRLYASHTNIGEVNHRPCYELSVNLDSIFSSGLLLVDHGHVADAHHGYSS